VKHSEQNKIDFFSTNSSSLLFSAQMSSNRDKAPKDMSMVMNQDKFNVDELLLLYANNHGEQARRRNLGSN
jgi:hypothetical protein